MKILCVSKLFVVNDDVPGVIGALGTTLGSLEVNISRMTVGMEEEKGRNIILLNTNSINGLWLQLAILTAAMRLQ